MAEPCEKCGNRPAFHRKHIGVVGENWVELSEWMWLCDSCAVSMKVEVDAAADKAREDNTND